MKTRIYTIIIISIMILCAHLSCQKMEVETVPLQVYSSYLMFPCEGSSETVSIQAEQKPMTVTPAWIRADIKKDSSKDKMWTMTLTCNVNVKTEDRDGEVVVTCLDERAVVRVAQKKAQPKEEDDDDDKDEEDDDQEEGEENVEITYMDILDVVKDIYKIKDISEGEQYLTLTFHEPSAFTVKGKEYSEGLQVMDIPMEDIASFEKDSNSLTIVFKSEVTVTLACYVAPQDTPESILLAVQRNYRFYSVVETDDEITVIFHEPAPLTLNSEYPDGIAQVSVPRAELTAFRDDVRSVSFTFASGCTATIQVADVPMEVVLDDQVLEFDACDHQTMEFVVASTGFTVHGARPERYVLTVIDDNQFPVWDNDENAIVMQNYLNVSASLIDSNKGEINVQRRNNEEFSGKIQVSLSNGITSHSADLSVVTHRVQFGITEDELKAGLTALYHACNGSAWERQDNWLTDRPVNEWEGVGHSTIIGKNGNPSVDVFSIELADNNMTGIVPDEFWEICKHATRIHISKNDLKGSVMPEKAWGKYLRNISMSSTRISLNLDHAINSPELSILYLYECEAEPLTEKFFNAEFPKLERLDYDCRDDMTTEIPSNVGNLAHNAPMLSRLSLRGQIMGDYQDGLFDITQLEELCITAYAEGSVPAKVQNMKNLVVLMLPYYNTSGVLPNELGNLKKLKYVAFGNCLNPDSYPEFLRYIPGGWIMEGFGPNQNLCNYQQIDRNGNEYELPMPDWYAERYGVTYWKQGHKKHPVWPNADDLDHPADEIFWVDGQWQHRPDMKYTE